MLRIKRENAVVERPVYRYSHGIRRHEGRVLYAQSRVPEMQIQGSPGRAGQQRDNGLLAQRLSRERQGKDASRYYGYESFTHKAV